MAKRCILELKLKQKAMDPNLKYSPDVLSNWHVAAAAFSKRASGDYRALKEVRKKAVAGPAIGEAATRPLLRLVSEHTSPPGDTPEGEITEVA